MGGDSRINTAQLYTDEVELDELAAAARISDGRSKRASIARSDDARD
jgi:hypothetical protein